MEKALYTLCAYNKDRGVYDDLGGRETLDVVKKVAKALYPCVLNGRLRDDTGEAYDWLCVEFPDGNTYHIDEQGDVHMYNLREC